LDGKTDIQFSGKCFRSRLGPHLSKRFDGQFIRRMDRWFVGLIMSALALVIEKVLLGSIRGAPQGRNRREQK
jgi:hypothetical protein